MFYVVEFVKEGTVEWIPSEWVINNTQKAFWPLSNIKHRRKMRETPTEPTYQKHPIRVLRRAGKYPFSYISLTKKS